MRASDNERLTRIGPGTPCGNLLRHYWQPVALLDEFDPAIDPRMAQRPMKPVRVMGEDFVLFRDDHGAFGLLDRACPHRGADLAFARHEGDGLRCPFHGWKFDATGRCLDTPGEPEGSRHCERVRARRYPVHVAGGVIFAWLGGADEGGTLPGMPEGACTPPPFPAFDCFAAPSTHVFAYKGLWHCNWLQAFEVGIDPAHTSFLHRFLDDEPLDAVADNRAGKQFRSASAGSVAGERWPMTRVMREFHRPDIAHEPRPWGMQITTLRPMTGAAGAQGEALTHVRVTHAIFPHTFVIPLSETLTITQMHLPVDDTHTYWYAFFTSFDAPVDKHAMREQRARHIPPPDYVPLKGRRNDWGFDADEQRTRTFLGMGEDDINVHDQWAVESMGAIQDRTREHLGTTDRVIIANRRMLRDAIDRVERGEQAPYGADPALAPQMLGPDTVDGIAPTQAWDAWWREQVRAKRVGAPWVTVDASGTDANAAASPSDPVAA
jgi:phenylpropionate dioxygenase-like ring-hydroxylating dioxygenase large terminal subunit